MGVLDGGLLGRGVGQRGQQLARARARGAPQDGVDEPVPAAGAPLGELDRVGHDRVVGRPAEVEQLVQAQAQGGENRRVEAVGGPLG